MSEVEKNVIQSLRDYLSNRKPLGNSELLDLSLIEDGNSSNHLNFKVKTSAGTYVARVTKPGDLLSYANVADEFTILKLVETYNVGPKSLIIDLEYFNTPLMFEEFIEGITYQNISDASEKTFEEVINLIHRVSNLDVDSSKFPFKFSYTSYSVDFVKGEKMMNEIELGLGKDHTIIAPYRDVLKRAHEYLISANKYLEGKKPEFIYNDVHPGNVFWIEQSSSAKFIDWQKVSTGDPSFMIALFAKRFAKIWNMEYFAFTEKVLKSYMRLKQITDFEIIFYNRLFERAVADMIWSVWADIKRKNPIKLNNIGESKHYSEVMMLMSHLGIR